MTIAAQRPGKPRRTMLWVRVVVFASLLTAGHLSPAGSLAQQSHPNMRLRAKPNLLIVIGDDHAGGTLGIDGDPRHATPHLDRLATRGVRFDRAYCNSPLCTPSRQSFITGLLPHAVGVTQLSTPLPDSAITLGHWLTHMGYETAAYGKMHFNNRSHHGFGERLDEIDWVFHLRTHPPAGGNHRRSWRPFHDPTAVWLNASCQSAGLDASSMESTFFADHAIEFMSRAHEKPFALVVGFYDPHAPFNFPNDWRNRYRPEQFMMPRISPSDRKQLPEVFSKLTQAEGQGIQAAYFTSLSFLDEQVGRILDALDSTGHRNDTLVLYLGDNGYMLGQHGRFEKHCMFEPAVRVPLLMSWPGHIPEGQRSMEQVELVDVFPTILELLRLPRPAVLHGQSLVPILTGQPTAKGREFVFSEYLENEEAMVRTNHYKFVVTAGRRLRKDGYKSSQPIRGPQESLYDIQADPEETNDLSFSPRYQSIKDELRTKLHHRLIGTRENLDPVPTGLTESESIYWCLTPRDWHGSSSAEH